MGGVAAVTCPGDETPHDDECQPEEDDRHDQRLAGCERDHGSPLTCGVIEASTSEVVHVQVENIGERVDIAFTWSGPVAFPIENRAVRDLQLSGERFRGE